MRPSAPFTGAGGKSGLRRAGCRVIPGGGDPEDSATESIPPRETIAKAIDSRGKGETAR